MIMRNDKHLAIKLRKAGKSYKEIEQDLGIGRSTLSDWFSNLDWSRAIKTELEENLGNKLSVATKRRWARWHEAAREEGRQTYGNLRSNPLFIAGLMLYWGEGDRRIENCIVGLSNTDPNMVRLFRLFLENMCDVPLKQLRAQMVLYPDLDELPCKQFWSNATGIPYEQFHKTQYIQGRHPTRRLTYGIVQIRFSHRQLKEKILVWIDLFQKEYQLESKSI